MLDHEYDTMRNVEDAYWWYRVLRQKTASEMKRQLAGKGDARILDAGCGTGGMMQVLREANPQWRVEGFDFSPLAVEHTRKRGFPDAAVGSVDALNGYADSCFDAVASLDVLCHKGLDQERAMDEFRRVLKPGGVLILNLPAFEFLKGRHDVAVGSERRYTPGDVRGLHDRHGLEIEIVHCWNLWLFFPILIWRQASRLFVNESNAQAAKSDLAPLPGPLNALLGGLGAMDASLCRAVRMPLGTSVFSVARKPDAS